MKLEELISAVVLLALVGIVIGLSATILTDIQGQQTADTIAYNATQSALEAQETLADWQPTIAIIVAASVVIGILLTYLLARFM